MWSLTPQSSSVLQDLLHTAQQHAEDRSLDVLVSMDRRRERLGQHRKGVVPSTLAEALDPGDVPCGVDGGALLAHDDDVGRDDDRPEGSWGVARALGRKAAVGADDLDPIPGLGMRQSRKLSAQSEIEQQLTGTSWASTVHVYIPCRGQQGHRQG